MASATATPSVLIVGETGDPTVAPELYDPGSGKFTAISGAPPFSLVGHIGTLLPDGDVLIAGGQPQAQSSPSSIANLYDPQNGGFISLPDMENARSYHTVSQIAGKRFLITGGIGGIMGLPPGCSVVEENPIFSFLSSAEVFDTATRTFNAVGDMQYPRWGHTATTLSDGRVLITGGQDGRRQLTCGSTTYCGVNISNHAEIFDPATGMFTPTGDMNVTRYQHTATLMPNGKVLIAGGWDDWPISCSRGFGPYQVANSTEIYDPATGTFTLGPTMQVRRLAQAAILLRTGKVLIAGGFNGTQTALAELYDPDTNTFAGTGSMNET